jgi:hypothetical protein
MTLVEFLRTRFGRSMRRAWFQDEDGTYFRNCPLIMNAYATPGPSVDGPPVRRPPRVQRELESVKTPVEIQAMIDVLEENIDAIGWDAAVDGASTALRWVLGNTPADTDAMLRRSMDRPEADRRRDWIARGGNPEQWTDESWRP